MLNTEDRQVNGEVSTQGDFLEGMAIVFDSISETLSMEVEGKAVVFREKIANTALDNLRMDLIICCADHDESIFLGISPKTLSLEKTDRGLNYKCLLPGSKKELITERVNRKEYTGNSFRFAIPEGSDTWEKMPDDTYLRTINVISYIAHIGPVFRPAYSQTHLDLAKRSFEVCVTVKIENNEGEGEDMNDDSMEKLCARMGYKSISDYKLKNLERTIKK